MSVTTSTPIPAGWYPDPHGNAQQRWWDGDSWTSDVAPYEAAPQRNSLDEYAPRTVSSIQSSALSASTVLPSYNAVSAYGAVQAYTSDPTFAAPPAPAAPELFLKPASESAQNDREQAAAFTQISTSISFQPDIAAVPYQPFEMVPRAREGIQTSPTQRFTVSVWLFALTPLVLATLSIILSHGPAGLYTRFSQGGLAVLAISAMVMLAIRDGRDLQLAGHLRTASPWWMLLTPLGYLVARAVVVRKQTGYSATSPLLIGIFVIAAIVIYVMLQPATLALVLAASAA